MDLWQQITELCEKRPLQLPRAAADECHVLVTDDDDLRRICRWAKDAQLYLCTFVVNDERLLESHAYKLYYLFSTPDGQFLILENPLHTERPTEYISIRDLFPSVEPMERKAFDLFGIIPLGHMEGLGRFVLHEQYPPNLHPLRRTRNYKNLAERQAAYEPKRPSLSPLLPAGMMVLPVGPIHAGIIEAGQFPFAVAGEVIEDVPVRLGFKHKGIEKLLESHYSLLTGWELAGKVSGDASFAHSMAYCQAVEAMAAVEIPEAAHAWRAFFLELERIYNHIADVGALAHDMALDLVASELAVLRETAVQLNQQLCGHRYLRGINRPGGVFFAEKPDLSTVTQILIHMQQTFAAFSTLLLEMPACRDRMITTGVLTADDVRRTGATGLAARAAGLLAHDFRLRHPQGVYQRSAVQQMIQAAIPQENDGSTTNAGVYQTDLKGDVFGRMALRVAEVYSSVQICCSLIDELTDAGHDNLLLTDMNWHLTQTPNYEFGIGYVESWRGDIFYWVMKGPDNTIFRC
ncbi:MAG: NADH-quinone oxidoreductase subunit C, partial [Anaerolineales bacterium]|nr:NADH-quinone oxidoreductase subunit C [Anaerolineales bacterium]